jgi:LCP family protein required for cell wall assembly
VPHAAKPVSQRDEPPASGRGARRRRPLWATLLMVVGLVLVLGSVSVIVGVRLVVHEATKSVAQTDLFSDPPSAQPTHISINGPKNILLVGIDSRANQPTDPIRSDSIIILHVAAGHDRADLISIPRDTYVAIPGHGHNKINAAFADGGSGYTGPAARQHGFELLAQTITSLYGITFDAGAIVDFAGFQQVVAALGGVCMTVDEDTTSIHIGFTKNHTEKAPYHINSDGTVGYRIDGVTPQFYPAGPHCFSAWQALDYVRQRDLLANRDFDYGRQRHQQQFIKAVFKKILSAGVLTNPLQLSSVLNAVGKAMIVDTRGIPLEDWIYAMRGIGGNDLTTIRTNGGQLNSDTVPGVGSVERLTDASLQLLDSVRTDTVDGFLATHSDWVAS